MLNDKISPWITAGYATFAEQGISGLKIEVIARKVNKSKSSFYHHFADLEIFIDYLLEHHIKQAELIAEKAKALKNINPSALNLILDHKLDIFFHKQLRINRDKKNYRDCFEKAYYYIGSAFMHIWTTEIGLNDNKPLSKELLDFVEENFYISVTEKNFTFNWLSEYFKKITDITCEIKKSP